jgi:hypothetical protein
LATPARPWPNRRPNASGAFPSHDAEAASEIGRISSTAAGVARDLDNPVSRSPTTRDPKRPSPTRFASARDTTTVSLTNGPGLARDRHRIRPAGMPRRPPHDRGLPAAGDPRRSHPLRLRPAGGWHPRRALAAPRCRHAACAQTPSAGDSGALRQGERANHGRCRAEVPDEPRWLIRESRAERVLDRRRKV